MTLAMILAHLVGDYVLQWNSLAAWKARAYKGVLAHCAVVQLVTLLFILPIDPHWWPWALFIGGAHLLIDSVNFAIKNRIAPLPKFVLDQLAHGAVIAAALAAGGYLAWPAVAQEVDLLWRQEAVLLLAIGYAFVTMPAWVVVKLTAAGLVAGGPPNFADEHKYVEILERVLITTAILLNQFLLAPLIVLPRLLLEWPRLREQESAARFLTELLASSALAVVTGLLLRVLLFV